jgi:thiamine pyrophosphokinase
VHEPEQESTDFTKALRWLRAQNRGSQCVDVMAFGSMGGRVDQGLSTVHHLFKAVRDKELLDGEIYLLSEQSLSFVMRRDWNEIHGLLSHDKGRKPFGENVGIIPLCGPAVISTKGLEWDVKDWRTEMGGQVSTSNHVKSDVVEIEPSEPVLFTVELADAFCVQ